MNLDFKMNSLSLYCFLTDEANEMRGVVVLSVY